MKNIYTASTYLKRDIRRIASYLPLGIILLTSLICLIFLHYWIIYGNFRVIFVQNLAPSLTASLPIALQEQLGWAFGCVLFYFVVPALVIRFVLRHKILSYGWKPHLYWRSFPLYVVLYLPVLIAILIVARQPEFQRTYPFYMPSTYKDFFIWEVAYVTQFVVVEFFFRGFILLGVRRYLNNAAAMLAMLFPYTMLHFTKPYLEASASIIAGLVLGYLVLKTRSIWGGITVHAMVGVTMDVVALTQRGWFNES